MSFSISFDNMPALKKLEGIEDGLAAVDGYSAEIVNPVSYASAVEEGYTRTMKWADMSKEQRYAIIMSAKKASEEGKGENNESKATVTRFEGGFEIEMPGVGMVSRSIPEIEEHMRKESLLITVADEQSLKGLIDDAAAFGLLIITEKTPVDQSALINGWNLDL